MKVAYIIINVFMIKIIKKILSFILISIFFTNTYLVSVVLAEWYYFSILNLSSNDNNYSFKPWDDILFLLKAMNANDIVANNPYLYFNPWDWLNFKSSSWFTQYIITKTDRILTGYEPTISYTWVLQWVSLQKNYFYWSNFLYNINSNYSKKNISGWITVLKVFNLF